MGRAAPANTREFIHQVTLLQNERLLLAERSRPGSDLGSQGGASSQSILDRSCRRADSEYLVQMINVAGTLISTEPTERRCSTAMSLNRCRKCAR